MMEQQHQAYDSGGGTSSINMMENSSGYHNTSGGSISSTSFGGVGSASVKTSFFQSSNQSKYEDLKQMLESSKELLKLEAMKRIIMMVAKGRSAESARELFPHVVKNVVTKNTELKKLVYLYLTRYAEQEQELALLSIATFQHALKDPNPLIRGSAIRVLSSIRVPMISPIVLIAIKDCANDMSPYVRKTAAHAILKLVSLDPEIKNDVIDIIAKLLDDKISLVLGSAVAAFEEVCPDRFDLIHQNYHKLCHLLVDVDEWGQIIIINMLMRYARTQFINPSQQSSSGKIDPDHMLLLRSVKPLLQSRNSGVVLSVIQLYLFVAPHFEITPALIRPLIRLLHSHHEIQLIILKNIVTLTSNDHNQKWLESIDSNGKQQKSKSPHQQSKSDSDQKESDSDEDNKEKDDDDDDDELMTIQRSSSRSLKSLFEPYLKSFFVKANDPTQIKILNLEILTNLSNSGNISLILREFQAYILNYQDDLEFMSATIESIGQCASMIKEIAPICLNGLVSLLSNRNEIIVAQSIVVIRSQIINKDDTIISMIVRQIVKLMDKIFTPQARATIVWIVAEFCSRNKYVHSVAFDVLRQITKTFIQENDLVKLQALNLAAKLHLITLVEGTTDNQRLLDEANLERLKLLINYVFNLAKYDLNYDVRDRGRFLKQLITNPELAKKILIVPKMVPNVSQRSEPFIYQQSISNGGNQTETLASSHTNMTAYQLANSTDSCRFRIGTLSHFIGKKVSEYEELPDWPETAPDPSVRKKLEQPKSTVSSSKFNNVDYSKTKNGFLTNSEEEEEEEEDEEEEFNEEIQDTVKEDYEEVDYDEEDDDEEEEEENSDEESDEEESDDESDDENEEENNIIANNKININHSSSRKKPETKTKQTVEDLLLLDFSETNNDSSTNSIHPSAIQQSFLPLSANISPTTDSTPSYRVLETPETVDYQEFSLLKVDHDFRASYRFPRINEDQRTLVEIILVNELSTESQNSNRITIEAVKKNLVKFKNILEVEDDNATIQMQPNETRLVTLSVDFNESPSLGIELKFKRSHTVKLVASLGDILYPVKFVSSEEFKKEQSKLAGMNEVVQTICIPSNEERNRPKSIDALIRLINSIILNLANVCSNSHLIEVNNGDSSSPTKMILYYSACTVKFRSLVLINIQLLSSNLSDQDLKLQSIVNCEKMVIASLLSKMIKDECLKQL